jgi:cobalt transporter subunit CbtB
LAVRRSLAPALFAALLGIGLIFVAGFAESSILHNAAHDGRHAFAFPCH